MDARRDQLLTGAAFANNKHRPVELCDTRDVFQDFKEGLGFTDKWLLLLTIHQVLFPLLKDSL
jgi:hypothetical protein